MTQSLTPPQERDEPLELDEAKLSGMLQDFERLELETKQPEMLQDLKSDGLTRQLPQGWRASSAIVSYLLVTVGALSLVFSIALSSTMLVFAGLGLTFWGSLLLFIRPQNLVRSDLMDSTAMSSLQAVDHLIDRLGYTEKGIYIPGKGNPGTVVFLPSEHLQEFPSQEQIEKLVDAKNGIVLVPPGLGLADLFERELGEKFNQFTLVELRELLPKLLIEDLEIVDDFDMQIDGSIVRMRLVGSVYTDFCKRLKSKRVCSMMGCPICSAMACVLAKTTGKPVTFEDETKSHGTMVSKYRIVDDTFCVQSTHV